MTSEPPKKRRKLSVKVKNEMMMKMKIKHYKLSEIKTSFKPMKCVSGGLLIYFSSMRRANGKYLFECVIADDDKSIGIKFWGDQALQQQSIFNEYRGVKIEFTSNNIKKSNFDFALTGSDVEIWNPTIYYDEKYKRMKFIKFNYDNIENIINDNVNKRKKVDITGIVTGKRIFESQKGRGVTLLIGDETATCSYTIWNIEDYPIEVDSLIVLKNVKISKGEQYVRVEGGFILNESLYNKIRNFSKIRKKLMEHLEEDLIIKFQEFDSKSFVKVSLKKLKQKASLVKDGMKIKNKYFQTTFIAEFNALLNPSDCIYYSFVNDQKNKKIKIEDIDNYDEKDLKLNFAFKIDVIDGASSIVLTAFGREVQALLGKNITAEDFDELCEEAKEKLINDCVGKRLKLYIKSRIFKAEDGNSIYLRHNVRRLEIICNDNDN